MSQDITSTLVWLIGWRLRLDGVEPPDEEQCKLWHRTAERILKSVNTDQPVEKPFTMALTGALEKLVPPMIEHFKQLTLAQVAEKGKRAREALTEMVGIYASAKRISESEDRELAQTHLSLIVIVAASCAFLRGGVDIYGVHFEAEHPEGPVHGDGVPN